MLLFFVFQMNIFAVSLKFNR